MQKSTLDTKYKFLILGMVSYFVTKMLWDKITFDLSEYISFLVILYGAFLYFKKIYKKDLKYLALYLIFSIYILLNGFAITDFSHMLRGIYEYIFYGLIFFSFIPIHKKVSSESYDRVFAIVGYLGVLLATLTAFEFFRGIPLLPSGELGTNITGYGFVFRATLFARSYLSHGLVMGVISIIELHNYFTKRKKKWIVFYFLCAGSILFTSSRGPLVATFSGSVIYLLNYRKSIRLTKKVFLASAFLIILLVVFGYVILLTDFTPTNPTLSYFLTRIRNIFNWSGDGGNVGRIIRWTNYWNHFCSNNILLGSGVATAGSSRMTNIMGSAESGILKRLVELGIIGFSLYYYYVIDILVSCIKRQKINHNNSKRLNRLCLSIIACILVDDITLQITEEIMISFLFWLFMSLLYVNSFYRENDW